MKYLFTMGHPAHFHLYKHTISRLMQEGHQVKVVISEKDILKKILSDSGFPYETIASVDTKNGLIYKAKKIFRSSLRLVRICRSYKPDLMIGCLTQMGIVGFILRIPTIFNAEDDITYTFLQCLITYPFISTILTPSPTNVGWFNYKRIGYEGYHKLAYLHPNQFKSNYNLVQKNLGVKPYVLVRLVKLNAYHDVNARGITEPVLTQLIEQIKDYSVYISSESPLPDKFNKYRLNINESDIHHYLNNASFFIGDSQSMTVEAAMLGVPNIKFNSFYGKISVLSELENKYKLTIGLSPNDEKILYTTVGDFIDDKALKTRYLERQGVMLSEKIEVSSFFFWFFTNYPDSRKIMKKNPSYQFNFQ